MLARRCLCVSRSLYGLHQHQCARHRHSQLTRVLILRSQSVIKAERQVQRAGYLLWIKITSLHGDEIGVRIGRRKSRDNCGFHLLSIGGLWTVWNQEESIWTIDQIHTNHSIDCRPNWSVRPKGVHYHRRPLQRSFSSTLGHCPPFPYHYPYWASLAICKNKTRHDHAAKECPRVLANR